MVLFVTFAQTNTAYYIFTGNMSYYGGGLLSPNHYTTAFSPNVNHEWNKHKSQHKNKKRWPGFKLKLELASDEQVSTVPPHHQCWFDELVYALSVSVWNPCPRQTPVSNSCLR